MKTFPTLYGSNVKGGIKIWNIRVEKTPIGASIITTHGLLNGKQQTDVEIVKQGKNIGQANETTVVEQALFEAESKWTAKQARKGYTLTQTAPTVKPLFPMLAKKYADAKHKIDWSNAFAQPKLNGVRCLAHIGSDGTIKFISRQGIEYTGLDHIRNEIVSLKLPGGTILDGELFNEDLNLQEIISRVKRVKSVHEKITEIQYHIYDLADDTMTFKERNKVIHEIFKKTMMIYIKKVPTVRVQDETEMKKHHQLYVSAGYEGIIIRNGDGKYQFNHRSSDLIKYKEFQDDEFLILKVIDGVGREAGLALFMCETRAGQTFTVRPKGTFEVRQQWFKNGKRLVGEKLTVRYQELSMDGIPLFPIGIAIRDYE